jgi:hypothetical protein
VCRAVLLPHSGGIPNFALEGVLKSLGNGLQAGGVGKPRGGAAANASSSSDAPVSDAERLLRMWDGDRDAAARDGAVEAYCARFADEVAPQAAVNDVCRLLRARAASSEDAAARIVSALDGRFLLARQARQLVDAAGGDRFRGLAAAATVVCATLDPWQLHWDGMDGCFLACCGLGRVKPLTAADVRAYIQCAPLAAARKHPCGCCAIARALAPSFSHAKALAAKQARARAAASRAAAARAETGGGAGGAEASSAAQGTATKQ